MAIEYFPEDYGAPRDGVNDDAPAVQDAIDAAALDQGVVYLEEGPWVFKSQITVKKGVTLRGSGYGFDQVVPTLYGTVIDVEWGSGTGATDDVNKAAVLVEQGTTIERLAFNYPSQSANSFYPSEYGATIKMYRPVPSTSEAYHGDVTLQDLMFYKSWVAIDSRGSSARTSGAAFMTTHRYDNINMAALKYGIRLQNVSDWFILSRIEQQPGFISATEYGIGTSLRDFVQKGCTFIQFSDLNDWLQLSHCTAWATAVGFELNGVSGPLTFTNCEIDAARVPVYLKGSSNRIAAKFIGCTFTAFDAIQDANSGTPYYGVVAVADSYTTGKGLHFNGCWLGGPSKGWIWFANPGVNIDNLSVVNCETDNSVSLEAMVNTGATSCDYVIVKDNFKGNCTADYIGGASNKAVWDNI